MKNLSRVAGFGLFLFLIPETLGAADSLPVVINEIAWMGTAVSTSDEWIELFNPTDGPITLDGWILKTADEKIKIILGKTIPANGFYLMERTNDDSVPGVPADLTYTGALANKGEDLKLFDNSNNLIDEVNCSAEWFAGNNAAKLTMERINPLIPGSDPSNWQNSLDFSGTPKTQNSRVATEIKTPAAAETPPLLTYPDGVIINELLPSPEGPDETEEWIELFNQNQSEVDLSGWKIKDSQGAVITFSIPPGTKIPGSGFLVFPRPTTRITLNNDNDQILLLRPDGKTADSVDYEKAITGQSYSRADADWFWSSVLTPGLSNRIVSPGTGKEQVKKDNSKEKQANSGNKELAAISEPFKKDGDEQGIRPFPSFFIALTISLFSGILILLLKKKIKPVS